MQTVFVVISSTPHNEHDDDWVRGVFVTREAALKFINHWARYEGWLDFRIEEMPLIADYTP